MRTIERTNQFKRDYKREAKGQHRTALENDFIAVIKLLVNDIVLPEKYRDHALTGDWKDFRDAVSARTANFGCSRSSNTSQQKILLTEVETIGCCFHV